MKKIDWFSLIFTSVLAAVVITTSILDYKNLLPILKEKNIYDGIMAISFMLLVTVGIIVGLYNDIKSK